LKLGDEFFPKRSISRLEPIGDEPVQRNGHGTTIRLAGQQSKKWGTYKKQRVWRGTLVLNSKGYPEKESRKSRAAARGVQEENKHNAGEHIASGR
jgi:hypothetical protein